MPPPQPDKPENNSMSGIDGPADRFPMPGPKRDMPKKKKVVKLPPVISV
jgi:hypothetical protein